MLQGFINMLMLLNYVFRPQKMNEYDISPEWYKLCFNAIPDVLKRTTHRDVTILPWRVPISRETPGSILLVIRISAVVVLCV